MTTDAPTATENPLARIVAIARDNDALAGQLAEARVRVRDALAYLDRPDHNARFGEANLDRCRVRHSRVLSLLRANRIEALRILGSGESGV